MRHQRWLTLTLAAIGTTSALALPAAANATPAFTNSSSLAANSWRADVNGDGAYDSCAIIGSRNFVDSRVLCDLAGGGSIASGVIDWGYPDGRAMADMNGDGRADYCRVVGDRNFVSSYVSCTLSTGTGFGATVMSGVLDWGYPAGRFWADVNGDRMADFCRRVGDSPNIFVSCTLSTGYGFGATVIPGSGPGTPRPPRPRPDPDDCPPPKPGQACP